jgi:serine/threonine protein kinase
MSDPNPLPATGPPGPSDPAAKTAGAASDQPTHIGRYHVERLLGEGAYGRVYLARDEELNRRVAVKLPLPDRIECPGGIEDYLAEARALAGLDHPHIVPVYDVGRTENGGCFLVSKFIEGTDLAGMIRDARPSFPEAAALVATVAEALHHAHLKGFVHRDVKPANILIDSAGAPHVADFGQAQRDEDAGKGFPLAGTPFYMSPEQAGGQAHLVDGRSDVFSLGVVFYELLTGRRPFRGETWSDLQQQITSADARPPRQIDDTIPKELEQICLTALARPLLARYTTAKDFADDLRSFLSGITLTTFTDDAPTPESDGEHCPVCHHDIGVIAVFVSMFTIMGSRPICPHCDTALVYKDTGLLDLATGFLALLTIPACIALGLLYHNYIRNTGEGVLVSLGSLFAMWTSICVFYMRYLRRRKRLIIARR